MTTLRILHLSDTHILGAGALHSNAVDTVAAYKYTLEAFEHAGPLDLVVVSGDVSDDGSPASYATVRSLTGAFAARHGAVAIYAMGNHDERDGFRQVLRNGHPGDGMATPDACVGAESVDGVQSPIVGVSEVAGYRILTLDSSVPGRTHGFVDAGQLAWLGSVLAEKSRHGTVVVIHHPPVPPVTALHHGIELINAPALADAFKDSDVVAILSGHYHHHLTDVLATASGTIPVVVTSGVVNSNDVLAAPGHERAVAGSGGTLVTISALPAAASRAASTAQRTVARVRTLPIRVQLPQAISPSVVFNLDSDAVARISSTIAATDAEHLAASGPGPGSGPTDSPVPLRPAQKRKASQ